MPSNVNSVRFIKLQVSNSTISWPIFHLSKAHPIFKSNYLLWTDEFSRLYIFTVKFLTDRWEKLIFFGMNEKKNYKTQSVTCLLTIWVYTLRIRCFFSSLSCNEGCQPFIYFLLFFSSSIPYMCTEERPLIRALSNRTWQWHVLGWCILRKGCLWINQIEVWLVNWVKFFLYNLTDSFNDFFHGENINPNGKYILFDCLTRM